MFIIYFLMKLSIVILALINEASAELGVWNTNGYCDSYYFGEATEISTIENTMFSLEDCATWCIGQDQLYSSEEGTGMCCDYEGWSSGLSDCTLYGQTYGFIDYENYGVYGDTDYNFYAGMNFTSGTNGTIELPTPGIVCVNDDSTGDTTGDTCSSYYDLSP